MSDSNLESQPVASRSTTISLYGKCDQEIRFRVDDATFNFLQKEGQGLGMTHNEFARLKVLIGCYGIEHVTSLAKDLVERVARSGKDGA